MFLLVINSFPTKKNSLDFHRRETQRKATPLCLLDSPFGPD